ncbi:hypothetical protein BN946_scf184649.g27 [Trametes cinnabarina]|uniref:F-box domain-containing protein n=1 Tax=Pycnoporus cinnabarinus TaxID=5643 RepID=A0A060SPJ4_PYCCI|nr:hypothetical protein BN946_scf184649.g27 [Trametes cinnabarina]
MQRPSPKLPLDICLGIVDAVAADDSEVTIATLKACALTSSAWLPLARRHLYRNVVVWREGLIFSFLRTIAASPKLGAFVEILEIRFIHCDVPPWKAHYDYAFRVRNPQGSPIFILLRHALPHFTHLHWLKFDSSYLYPCTAMLLFISQFSAVKTVTDLEIDGLVFSGYRDLVTLVNPFYQVERLVVKRCNWTDLDIPQRLDLTRGRSLRFLEFEGNLYEYGVLELCPSTVDTLFLGPPKHEPDRLETDPDEKYEALSRYTELEVLSLRASLVRPGESMWSEWLEWVPEALSHVRSMNLRSLDLPIKIYAEGAQLDGLRGLIDWTQLSRVDEILASGSFPNLCIVHVTLEVYDLEDLELWEMEKHGLVEDLLASFSKCPDLGIDVQIYAWECPAP